MSCITCTAVINILSKCIVYYDDDSTTVIISTLREFSHFIGHYQYTVHTLWLVIRIIDNQSLKTVI